jgi:hypothetical protein
MFENSSLNITFNTPNLYSFAGRIDETFPVDLNEKISQDLVHFDFKDLSYMNSMGIMKFILFLNSLPKAASIYYENVPAFIVTQMGLVKGIMSQRFKMKSFYVPYVDKESQEQLMILINIEDVLNHSLPYKKNPETGSMMEPDVQVERFLSFLNHI